jgi:hypothetical protein
MTYIPTWAGFIYLAVVLDVWSRRVVGWSIGESMTRRTGVGRAEHGACRPAAPEAVIHHSDQGSQYTSVAFGKRCQEMGVRPSMGSGRRCLRQRHGRELLRQPGMRASRPALLPVQDRGPPAVCSPGSRAGTTRAGAIRRWVGKAGKGVFFESKLVARCFRKHDFYGYLEENGINWKLKISKKLLPDDALLVVVRETLFIVEVKYQQVAGSVDEKLQTCDFKRKQYVKLVADLGLKVEYVYVLNDWFKAPGYKDVLDYIHSVRACPNFCVNGSDFN